MAMRRGNSRRVVVTGFCVVVVVVGRLVVVGLVVVVLLVVVLLVVLLVVVVLVVCLGVLVSLWVVVRTEVGSGLSVTTQNLFFPEVPFFPNDFFLHAGVVAGVVAGDGVGWVARGRSGICGPF